MAELVLDPAATYTGNPAVFPTGSPVVSWTGRMLGEIAGRLGPFLPPTPDNAPRWVQSGFGGRPGVAFNNNPTEAFASRLIAQHDDLDWDSKSASTVMVAVGYNTSSDHESLFETAENDSGYTYPGTFRNARANNMTPPTSPGLQIICIRSSGIGWARFRNGVLEDTAAASYLAADGNLRWSIGPQDDVAYDPPRRVGGILYYLRYWNNYLDDLDIADNSDDLRSLLGGSYGGVDDGAANFSASF